MNIYKVFPVKKICWVKRGVGGGGGGGEGIYSPYFDWKQNYLKTCSNDAHAQNIHFAFSSKQKIAVNYIGNYFFVP